MQALIRNHVSLLAVLLVALLLTMACDSNDPAGADADHSHTPTAAANVTPADPVANAEKDGPGGFRAFASQVQAAFDRHDTAFITGRMKASIATCTSADVARKGPPGTPVCTTVGATFSGFRAGAWASEWYVVSMEEASGAITNVMHTAQRVSKDSLGAGTLRIEALNVAPGEYRVIATAIAARPADVPPPGSGRVSLSLTAVFEDGRWQFTSLLSAWVKAEDLLSPGTEFTTRLTGWEPFRPAS